MLKLLRWRRVVPALTVPLVLGGCAVAPTGDGLAEVAALTRERAGLDRFTLPEGDPESAEVAAAVEALLARPLGMDEAVQVALLNNRGLQASYAALGIGAAELAQARQLPNPSFTFGRLTRPGDLEIERKLTLPVLGLLTLPLRQRVEGRRFAAAQLRTALDALTLVDQTRRAWVQAVAALASARQAERVVAAAEAAADLARRMAERGNWSALQAAREQAFHGDASARLVRAGQTVVLTRERLVRLLGLTGTASLRLPEQLPDLPAAPANEATAAAMALQNRLDLVLARQQVAALADDLGLVRVTRMVSVLDFSLDRNTASGQAPQTGYEIELQLPLFDWGEARVARAEATYRHALQQTAQLAIEARSEARAAQAAVLAAWRLAQHYRTALVPLRQRIAQEQLLRYNGMLTSVFELLADARERVLAVDAALDATRDYWLAEADLRMTLTGRSVSPLPVNAAAPEGARGATH